MKKRKKFMVHIVFAKSLIQKNVDNFYHRAWVIKEDRKTMMYVKNVKKRMKVLNKI